MEIEETDITATIDDTLSMKENLLGVLDNLRKAGIDLSETPAVFRWVYPEEPFVWFQVAIVQDSAAPEGVAIQ